MNSEIIITGGIGLIVLIGLTSIIMSFFETENDESYDTITHQPASVFLEDDLFNSDYAGIDFGDDDNN